MSHYMRCKKEKHPNTTTFHLLFGQQSLCLYSSQLIWRMHLGISLTHANSKNSLERGNIYWLQFEDHFIVWTLLIWIRKKTLLGCLCESKFRFWLGVREWEFFWKSLSLDALRFPNFHSNECETLHLHRDYFRLRLKFQLHTASGTGNLLGCTTICVQRSKWSLQWTKACS